MKNISTYKKTPLTPTKSSLMVVLLALALVAWGCEDSKVVSDGPKDKDGEQTDLSMGKVDDAGHGPDDDAVLIAPGFVNGSWRVGAVEDQSLVVDLDLIQEDESTEVEGYFTMSVIAGNGADGKGGDVMETSSFDGDQLTVQWNPTGTDGDIYTVEATKIDDNTFSGTVSSALFSDFDKDIHITRYATPPSTDEGDEESADTIDAGPQGGAGGE